MTKNKVCIESSKKVLLLGGTGAIGSYLIEECIRLGYTVFVTTRSLRVEDEKIKFIRGNAKDISFLNEISKKGKFDVVIDFMVYATHEFKVNIDLLLSLGTQYIYVSSYRVFSDTGHEPITETSPRLIDTVDDSKYLSTDEYALAKARQEDILTRDYRNRNWTIVRPSITYSTNRFQFGALEANTILPRARDKLAVPIPESMLDKKTTMTWAGDVAKMIASVLGNQKAYNEAFNTLTDEYKTWKEIADIYASKLEMIVEPVDDETYQKIGLNPWQIKYDRMLNRICSNDKIISFSGLNKSDFMSLESGLQLEINNNRNMSINYSSVNRINGILDKILCIYRFPRTKSLRYLLSYCLGRFLVIKD